MKRKKKKKRYFKGFQVTVFWDMTQYSDVLGYNTNIVEDHAASIFRVKISNLASFKGPEC
jgi:hypothetical protein